MIVYKKKFENPAKFILYTFYAIKNVANDKLIQVSELFYLPCIFKLR